MKRKQNENEHYALVIQDYLLVGGGGGILGLFSFHCCLSSMGRKGLPSNRGEF